MRKLLVCLTALPLLAFSSMASALTCDDVVLSDEILSQFPTAQDACREVVERDGSQFVKMKVHLTRSPGANRATFRFVNNDGSMGPTYAADLPAEWRANIGGRDYRLRELARGQELSLYLPSDRWAAHVSASEVMDDEITVIVITMAEPEPAAMLPATAGNMPLFALFGFLALAAAGFMRMTRRQTAQ